MSLAAIIRYEFPRSFLTYDLGALLQALTEAKAAMLALAQMGGSYALMMCRQWGREGCSAGTTTDQGLGGLRCGLGSGKACHDGLDASLVAQLDQRADLDELLPRGPRALDQLVVRVIPDHDAVGMHATQEATQVAGRHPPGREGQPLAHSL